MKICRFKRNDSIEIGVFDGENITIPAREMSENIVFGIDQVELLPPVVPAKIICVGRNYASHAAELGNEVPKEPLLFLKAPSALIINGQSIIIPEQSSQVEHEGELAVVIGRTCKNLSEESNAFENVYGYICLNDVTARDIQRRDVQFTRGKSFDTFCPISFFVETELDVADLQLTTKVNGQIKQTGKTSEMVFSVEFLIKYISRQMTLLPGDIIATGTPSGVSKLSAGDVCEVEIENLGKLSNPVE